MCGTGTCSLEPARQDHEWTRPGHWQHGDSPSSHLTDSSFAAFPFLLWHKCIASSNKCLTSSNKKLLGLVVSSYSLILKPFSFVGRGLRTKLLPLRRSFQGKEEKLRLRTQKAPSKLLVAMPFAPSSFLLLLVRPGAPSSFLLLVVRHWFLLASCYY